MLPGYGIMRPGHGIDVLESQRCSERRKGHIFECAEHGIHHGANQECRECAREREEREKA